MANKKADRALISGTVVLVISGALAILGQVIEFPFDLSWAADGTLTLSELFAFIAAGLLTLSDPVADTVAAVNPFWRG